MMAPNGKVIVFPGQRAGRRRQTSFWEKLAGFVIKAFSSPPPALWLCSPFCCACLSAPQTEALEVN